MKAFLIFLTFLQLTLAWHGSLIYTHKQTKLGLNTPCHSQEVNVVTNDENNELFSNVNNEHFSRETSYPSRRFFFKTFTVSQCLLIASTSSGAHALVKGIAPPSSKKKPSNESKLKCFNVDDCQALAEKKEAEDRVLAEAAQATTPIFKTDKGTRYRDLQEGLGKLVNDGDEVTIYYKVLKLGKRSYDGLSGEGTVVFSRGYGLEDDENQPGTKSLTTVVGSYNNIAALNDAVVGMKVGGIRRFAVLPQKGWRKPTPSCDGGPGGSGAGGDIKTDYVIVPTAQLVAEEACFDATKQPFPSTYAQQRRMAQRFDQSLIMEVQIVSVDSLTSGDAEYKFNS